MVQRVRLQPNFTSPVLIGESAYEQSEIQRQLEQEIKPKNIIERTYIGDVATLTFEILRFRRAQIAIINTSYRVALQNVLAQMLRTPGELGDHTPQKAEALALAWFTSEKAKEQVSKILGQFHLDESAIEAEAIRSSSVDVERIEGLLASLELRRSRALSFVVEYRASLAHQLQESANRIIETENVRALEHIRKKSTAA
jgi:hypothetical protein